MIEEEILTILYFAVPGVLTELYIRKFKPVKRVSEQFELYIMIVSSLVEWGLFYLIVGAMKIVYSYIPINLNGRIPEFLLHYGKYVLMFGLIWGCSKAFLRWNKIGTKKLLPLDTAWDTFFIANPHVFMEVHLVNGEIIYGEYANESYASSDNENADIYLERVYETNQDSQLIFDKANKPVDVEGNCGILILKEQIQYIVMFKDEGKNDTQR